MHPSSPLCDLNHRILCAWRMTRIKIKVFEGLYLFVMLLDIKGRPPMLSYTFVFKNMYSESDILAVNSDYIVVQCTECNCLPLLQILLFFPCFCSTDRKKSSIYPFQSVGLVMLWVITFFFYFLPWKHWQKLLLLWYFSPFLGFERSRIDFPDNNNNKGAKKHTGRAWTFNAFWLPVGFSCLNH